MVEQPHRPQSISPNAGRAEGQAGPVAPIFLFGVILIALGAVALAGHWSKAPLIAGLPKHAGIERISNLLRDRLAIETGGLRLDTALLGNNLGDHAFGAPDLAEVNEALAEVARAQDQLPLEVRLDAARAVLHLARREFDQAERGYREGLRRASDYGEARLGLGVTLALKARSEANPRHRRHQELSAIAQFANVREEDPAFEAALYNRALMLVRVGRLAEARQFASHYQARDPSSPWSQALAGALEAGER